MDLGVLLGLPLESIAIRVVLATLVAIVLVRALLRSGLRTPGARIATAFAPALAITAVLMLSWGSLSLPTVMLPVEANDALPIPVQNGYLHFAPIAAPLLVSVWAVLAGGRMLRRLRAARRARGLAERALRDGQARPEVAAVAARLASRLRVPSPRLAVVPSCAGGAYVVGCHRPIMVLGDDLVARLDDAELEGVIAHELAHVRRCDNLVSAVVGIVRDLTFFIPGGGWALAHLHRERELAADRLAVATTERPGALASGLLKVIEVGHEPANPCAALAPSGSLVSRVQVLVEDAPPPSPVRTVVEKLGVAAMCLAAVALSVALPRLVAGADGQRDAVALVWSPMAEAAAASAGPAAEPRAFDVYRRTNLEMERSSRPRPAEPDERSVENRRSTLHACSLDPERCPEPSARQGLGLTPRPTITVDHDLTRRWQAPRSEPVQVGGGFQLLWLQRAS